MRAFSTPMRAQSCPFSETQTRPSGQGSVMVSRWSATPKSSMPTAT